MSRWRQVKVRDIFVDCTCPLCGKLTRCEDPDIFVEEGWEWPSMGLTCDDCHRDFEIQWRYENTARTEYGTGCNPVNGWFTLATPTPEQRNAE